MSEIRFNLTVDSMFDFCGLLDTIGIESITGALKEDLKEIQKMNTEKDAEAVGMLVISKISGILIRNLPRFRNEICEFLAGCAEQEDGTPVTVDEIRKMKLMQFVKLIRDFLKTDGIADFFGEAAGSLPTELADLKNSVTGGMGIHMGI